MKTYTKGEIQAVIDAAYRRGWDDRGTMADRVQRPPLVEELVRHPMTSSDDPSSYRPRPWLDTASGA